jgi:cysteine desulfurase/selenocysteine lyase
MRRFGTPASTRASFAIHNTREDVDRLIEGLATVQGVFA